MDYYYIYILDVGIVLRLVSLESRELSVVESHTYPRDASSGRSDSTVFPDNLYINKLVLFKNHLYKILTAIRSKNEKNKTKNKQRNDLFSTLKFGLLLVLFFYSIYFLHFFDFSFLPW